jgi:hypothetical protein
VIFGDDRAAEMLEQCSRDVPAPGEAHWTPNAEDIARLEAALPAALAGARLSADARRVLAGAPAGWHRQYLGLVRGGRRFLYGNFLVNDGDDDIEALWRVRPLTVCDGGAGFFGAEYDVAASTFSHLAFNGR